MQTCKLSRDANFLLQLCLSFSLIPVCYACQKSATAIQIEIKQKKNDCRAGGKNCLNSMVVKECVAYVYIRYRLM